MNYKIGNKVDVIIRAFNAGTMGSMQIQYKNQPYTILRDVSATLTFAAKDANSRQGEKNLLSFNHDSISRIDINGVVLNDKILNLLYTKNEEAPLFSDQFYVTTDEEGNAFMSWPRDVVYQVFIYDNQGTLEKAIPSCGDTFLQLNKANHQYSVYFSYVGEQSFLLNKSTNQYVTLDLIVLGNAEDETTDMCIHIEKCGLSANKTLFLRDEINTIDLTATVLATNEDYITIL